MAKKNRFKILIADDGQFWWHLQAKNNKIVCSSQMFPTKEACIKGARWAKKKARKAKILDYTVTSG
jgi:uncharacterized protein YegP (UPF0339 family)